MAQKERQTIRRLQKRKDRAWGQMESERYESIRPVATALFRELRTG